MELNRKLRVQTMRETPSVGRRDAIRPGTVKIVVASVEMPARTSALGTSGVSHHHDAEVILPEQFFRPAPDSFASWTGERRLLFAVLDDALGSFLKHRCDRSRRGQRLFRETVEWFWNTEQKWLYSFENICQHLNLDADYIRAGLRRLEDAEGRDLAPFIGLPREKAIWSSNLPFARAA